MDTAMELAIAAFTLGAVFILIGLVGGDLSYHGLKVPRVGPLPRLTTTITGGVFLALGLAIYLFDQYSIYEQTTDTAGLTPPAQAEPTTSSTQQDIQVAFVDELMPNQVADSVIVLVDDVSAGMIECTQERSDGCVLRLSIADGQHSFEMSGQLLLDSGEVVELYGRGRFIAKAGTAFYLTITTDGQLSLVASA